jgi:SpoVK/Ycf46/Vps4 family AAA+-type ATPase
MSENPFYKYKDIKVFGSTEWLANNEKNYRQVFDESEISYIYCEISFYNKLFDEKDWDIKLELKCFSADNKEICALNCDRKVRKDENIVFVREGWGVKEPGSYWKRGSYRWEAHIDGKLLAERYFYVEKEGTVTKHNNPFFNLEDIKLYEGPDSNAKPRERRYFKGFNGSDTRYIWAELTAENQIKKHDFWACELIFHFKTKTGQLIGKIEKLIFVYPQDEKISCTVGWGSEAKGTWANDEYLIHVIFMNQLIAVIPFKVGYDYEEATEKDFTTFFPFLAVNETVPTVLEEVTGDSKSETLEDVMAELEALIGLETIKRKVREYTSYLKFVKLRREKGFQDTDKVYLHAVFRGNPGTGKTTVARMLGRIYKQMGLLTKGHVHEVDRGDLVAEYIGQTAPKTKEAIKKARGGVLFIDEAYALARKDDDAKDFGREAIEVIMKEMSDGAGDLAVVVAGYPEQMDGFLGSNPGLKSRFTVIFDFPDYLPQELMEIAEYTIEKKSVKLDKNASDYLYKKLVEGYRNRSKAFGNARFVNSLIDEAKMNLGLRVMKASDHNKLSSEELSLIELPDIEKIFEPFVKGIADIPVDEDLLRDSIGQLRSMIGLERVKSEIDELVKLVRFYRETGKDFRKSFSLHSVFTGNPGTGKTTVARILAQVFKALGILERGHLVECDRQTLVGGYVGQTAIKTGEMVEKAMGGVLFIDEAYALTEGGQGDYGKEAVEVLLKRMEDHRGEFIVIAAGYTQNMDRFLESNPGLKSRFDRVFTFEDYDADDMLEIAEFMFADQGVKMDRKAKAHMKEYLAFLYNTKDKFFGNGRAVRKVIESAIKSQHLRLAKTEQNERTPKMIETITIKDVEGFAITGEQVKAGSIGFKRG